MNVVLIGFRATGKSTVGKRLSELIDWDFLDTDDAVEEREGKTVAQIFSDLGEERFRRAEANVVRQTAALDRTVIAAGGGAVLDPANAATLARTGYIVLLTASVDEIERRMNLDTGTLTRRPALTGFDPRKEIERLLALRNEPYKALCNSEIDTTGKPVERVAEEIRILIKALPAFGKSRA